MDYAIRYARPEEFGGVADLDGSSFGVVYSAKDIEDAKLDVDLDAMLVAEHDGRFVGVSCEVPITLTLPGGAALPTVGLTWVSVDVTHRRRGILRALIERQIRDHAARGAAAMTLSASEGGIYGRYGFGAATRKCKVSVDRRAARLVRPLADPGVRRVTTGQAREVLPALYDRWRRHVPGAVLRNDNRWQLQLMDREYQRDGMSGLFHLVHHDGYVSYRMKDDWNDGHPQHLLQITDYVVATDDAHAALWQVLLGFDLVGRIESYEVPVDDPLPFLLADARAVRTLGVNDGLWVRPLDVTALLGSRSYAIELDVVIRVRDHLLGDRTVRLTGGPGLTMCVDSDDPPDVHADVAALGALSLGGTRLRPLLAAGAIRCDDPALATRIDRAFLADVAPRLGTFF